MDVFALLTSEYVKVLHRETTFIKSLKAFSSEVIDNEDVKFLSSVLGCSLRHHLVFSHSVNCRFLKIDDYSLCLISEYLSIHLFLESSRDEEFKEYLLNNVKVDKDVLCDYLSSITKENLIDAKVEKGSCRYISLRNNVPEWVIKSLMRQYGPKYTLSSLNANTKMKEQYLRVVKNKDTLLTDPEFAKTENEEVVRYLPKKPVRKNKFVLNHDVFPICYPLKNVLDSLDLDPIRPFAIYEESQNAILLELQTKYKNSLKGDVICDVNKDYFFIKNTMNSYKIKGIRLFEGGPESIKATISSPVSTFIVYFDGTNFESLREYPDAFLLLSSEKADREITKERMALKEAANFVETGGNLVYMVNTLNKKESVLLVDEFLNEHKEFSLISNKQYFPFEKENASFYYAILRKN